MFLNPNIFFQSSASNFKSCSRSLEQFFLTVGQNNFGNKIPLFYFTFFDNILGVKRSRHWQRAVTLFVQYWPVPGRETNHIGPRGWPHRLDTHGQHGLRCGRRGLHDSPLCARYHGHPHLPALTVLQTNCCTSWSRTESKFAKNWHALDRLYHDPMGCS